MLPLIAILAVSSPSFDAKALFFEVEKHYRGLESFSMNIEHHDSSGLFPGDYSQSLRWQKGKRFDLIVTKQSSFVPKENQAGGIAPNYFSDGSTITRISKAFGRNTESVAPQENTSPGWEVSAGIIISWLMDTPIGNFVLRPPVGLKILVDSGSRKSWRETPIREITINFIVDGQTNGLLGSFFVGEKSPTLLGYEFKAGTQSGWAQYKNQVENPKFDKPVGETPK